LSAVNSSKFVVTSKISSTSERIIHIDVFNIDVFNIDDFIIILSIKVFSLKQKRNEINLTVVTKDSCRESLLLFFVVLYSKQSFSTFLLKAKKIHNNP